MLFLQFINAIYTNSANFIGQYKVAFKLPATVTVYLLIGKMYIDGNMYQYLKNIRLESKNELYKATF